MDILYYYLEGKDQKGPLTVEQLKTVGLKPDTLVWTESFDSWKPAKEVSELADIIRKLPPPPPLVDNLQMTAGNNPQKEQKTIVEDSDAKFWVSFKVGSFIFSLCALIALISYLVINSKKENLKKEVNDKINSVFDSKTVILDGERTGVRGKLEETNYGNHVKKGKKNLTWLKFGKDSSQVDLSAILSMTWGEKDGLYTIFNCSDGGFTVKKLTKLNDEGYEIETYRSNDMGYRIPEYRYGITGYGYNEYGESNTYGKIDNDRQSIQSCYTGAFDFFTKDDKTGAYSPGKFVDITNFPDIRNEYFFFVNTEPKKYSSSGHSSSTWYSTNDHGANVFTDNYRVYYSVNGSHYELITNEEKIKKDTLIFGGTGIGLLLIIVVIILSSKPKFFRNLFLFGKRWKNNAYEDQILFFDYSFFGAHTFTEIINDNVSKGILKITDKGNTINLSYPNKELFYKIETLDLDNLKIASLKDVNTISFTRIGAAPIQNANAEESKTEAPITE